MGRLLATRYDREMDFFGGSIAEARRNTTDPANSLGEKIAFYKLYQTKRFAPREGVEARKVHQSGIEAVRWVESKPSLARRWDQTADFAKRWLETNPDFTKTPTDPMLPYQSLPGDPGPDNDEMKIVAGWDALHALSVGPARFRCQILYINQALDAVRSELGAIATEQRTAKILRFAQLAKVMMEKYIFQSAGKLDTDFEEHFLELKERVELDQPIESVLELIDKLGAPFSKELYKEELSSA